MAQGDGNAARERRQVEEARCGSSARPASAERPKRLRIKLKPELARAHSHGLQASGLAEKQLALKLELQPALLNRMGSRDGRESVNALLVRSAPPEARPWVEEVVRFQVQPHGLDVVPQPRDVHGSDYQARLASITNEGTDPIRCLSAALAPTGPGGREFTDTELETFERECREAAAVHLEGAAAARRELERRRAAR